MVDERLANHIVHHHFGDVVLLEVFQSGDDLLKESFSCQYLKHPMHDKIVKGSNIVSAQNTTALFEFVSSTDCISSQFDAMVNSTVINRDKLVRGQGGL